MQEDERTVLTGEVQQSIGKNDLSVVRFLQKPKFLRVRRLHPFEGIGPDKEPATVVTEIVFGPTPPGGDKPSPIASSKFFPLRCRNPTSVLVFHHLAGIVEQPIRARRLHLFAQIGVRRVVPVPAVENQRLDPLRAAGDAVHVEPGGKPAGDDP